MGLSAVYTPAISSIAGRTHTRAMPLAIMDRPAVSLGTAKRLKNSKQRASNAPGPNLGAEKEKHELQG
jgi:hypothetical protein